MPNTFTRKTHRNVGSAASRIGDYTAAANVTSTLIGLSVANTSDKVGAVDLFLRDTAGNSTYLVKGAPLPVGSALIAVGGDQKIVLVAGDAIHVAITGGATADVVMSLLEVSPEVAP